MSLQPQPEDIGFNDNLMFTWVEGMPRPRNSRVLQKEQLQQLYQAAGALPYRGEWNSATQRYEVTDERFVGCTMAEVAVMKDWDAAVQSNGTKERERVMDRIMGKPKQAVETKSMHMSYTEMLDILAKQDAQEATENYVDVSYTPEQYHKDLDDLTKGI